MNNVSILIPVTLGELNDIGCPGCEHHTGVIHISKNAIDAVAELHNNNLNNMLPEDVHVSLKHFLTDVTNFSLHNEVAVQLLYLAFNMQVQGMDMEIHGNKQVDQFVFAHICSFHEKLCQIFEQLPGLLTKPITFSPPMCSQ